jgi:peptidoglycan/xylan/chitin deacetylase (PgdA/CDA1 family)
MISTDFSRRYVDDCSRSLSKFKKSSIDHLTILLYHGVTDQRSQGIENYAQKHIPVELFRDDMAYINKHCSILSMDDVLTIHRDKDIYPPYPVVVTFDDGYENNATLAAPLLDELEIPATFYVCAGMVDTNTMFWTDAIEDCLNLTREVGIMIDLGGKPVSYSLTSDFERIVALDSIKSFCKRVSASEKDKIVADLESQTKVTPATEHAKNYRKVNWKQLKEIADNPSFIVGGHSSYHDILALQDLERTKKDISLCQELLSYNLHQSICHFSYPEGGIAHYNQSIIDFLIKCGVKASPSGVCGINRYGANPFHLRRIMVGLYGLPLPYNDVA